MNGGNAAPPPPKIAVRPPTVLDVAHACGVSHSTAAAALRESPKVKAATRKKILAAAARLGYQRNLAASVLGSKHNRYSQTLAIAMVSVYDAHHGGAPPRSSLHPLESCAKQRGFVFHRFPISSRENAAKLCRRMDSMGIEGVILDCHGRGDMVIELAPQWQRFSLVSKLPEYLNQGVDVVEADYFGAFTRVLRALRLAGYQRPGVILRQHQPMIEDDWIRLGAVLALSDRGAETLTIPPLKEPFWGGDPPPGYWTEWCARLRNWIDTHQPDVIFGFNSIEAKALDDIGICLPADIAFLQQSVQTHDLGKVAGLYEQHNSTATQMLNVLERKIRNRERGFSRHPLKFNFMPAFADGPTLPKPIATMINSHGAPTGSAD